MPRTCIALILLALGGVAEADQPGSAPVPAGRQADPPGPPAPAEAEPLPMAADGRRAVRGCDPDESCAGDLLQGLRTFEIEAFPRRRGDSPWSERDGGVVVNRVGARRRAAVRPTELR